MKPAGVDDGRMYCVQCHYPLDQLKEERCPECGRPFRRDDPASMFRVHGYRYLGLTVIAVSLAWGMFFAYSALIPRLLECASTGLVVAGGFVLEAAFAIGFLWHSWRMDALRRHMPGLIYGRHALSLAVMLAMLAAVASILTALVGIRDLVT